MIDKKEIDNLIDDLSEKPKEEKVEAKAQKVVDLREQKDKKKTLKEIKELLESAKKIIPSLQAELGIEGTTSFAKQVESMEKKIDERKESNKYKEALLEIRKGFKEGMDFIDKVFEEDDEM